MLNPSPVHSISAHPDPDESLIGFVFRLAKLRRHRSPRAIWAACGFKRLTNQPPLHCLEALAANARIPLADLEAISFGPPSSAHGTFSGMTLPYTLFDKWGKSDRRVCPQCLAEKPFHRAIWDIRLVAACPVHQKFLVATCQACRQPLKWRGNDLTRCSCLRGDLTRMQAVAVSEVELRGTRAAYGLLGQQAFRREADHVRSLEPFRDISDAAIVEFLCRIGMSLVSNGRIKFTLDRPGQYLGQFHLALTRGLELAERWPEDFLETLDRIAGRSLGGKVSSTLVLFRVIDGWLAKFPATQGVVLKAMLLEYRSRPRR